MTIIGVDAKIIGYTPKDRFVSYNARESDMYKSDKTIRDLIYLTMGDISVPKMSDVLADANIEINGNPVELEDGLKQIIDNAGKDALGIPQLKVRIEKPTF